MTSTLPPPPTTGRGHPSRRARRWLLVGALVFTALSAVAMGYLWLRTVQHLWSEIGPERSAGPLAVSEVVDGDTIKVRQGATQETVRLLGIDTPETKDPRTPVQCFGREASEATAGMLPPGTEVRLVPDVEERDRYDRVLAYVYRASDGLFVNLELVRRGYADTLTYPPNLAHTEELSAAVAEARREQVGLWRACGGPGRPAEGGGPG